jgi:dipeptidyl aminopeptidase/acylaminoacyl peptidase
MLIKPDISPDSPWKRRYRIPATYTQLAKAAPERGLAVNNATGVFQLYAWDVPTGALRQLTHRPTGIVNGQISPDGRWIYYLEDQAGNEIGHFVRVPFEGGIPEDVTPDLPLYSSFGLRTSRDSSVLGITVATDGGFQMYAIEAGPDAAGESRPIYRSGALTFGPTFSYAGEIAVAETLEGMRGLHFKLLAFDTATGAPLGELTDGPESTISMRQFAPVPGDDRALVTTDSTGNNRPLLWNPRTGERTDLRLDDVAGEVQPIDWSADGKRILLMQFVQAVQTLYLYDLPSHTVRRLEHPEGTFGGVYFGPDDTIFAHLQSSVAPSQLIALDASTGRQVRVVLPAAEVPPGRRWRSISFPSADGTPIQGWLGVPEGAGPFPTILDTHGGPTAVQTDAFLGGAQAWIDDGYAYCSINYRGSTTFGRDFEKAIEGDLGNREVDDMAGAYAWLVAEGIANPRQVLLTGWSYGGYLTLQALGRRPELWAGGIAGIAIADWAIQYEDTADTLKGYPVALLGGTPAEQPEVYRRASPITYAEQVRAPVLVIQGSNDTRCPARPMRMYEARLRELGKPIEVHWFEAGHGSYVVEQGIQHQELMMEFAYRVLSGE